MAEADPDVQPQLSINDILVMTGEELRFECRRRNLDAIGLTKPDIQQLLLAHIGATGVPTPVGQTGQASPLIEQWDTRPLTPRRAPLPDDDTLSIKARLEEPPFSLLPTLRLVRVRSSYSLTNPEQDKPDRG